MRRHDIAALAVLVASSVAVSGAMAQDVASPQKTTQNNQLSIEVGPPAKRAKKTIIAGAGEVFSDCKEPDVCPQMVVVPASPKGAMVGSPDDEPQRVKTEQQHAIQIPAFAIGRFEVRVSEYMACVDAGGCRHPEWNEPGGPHNIETGTGITYKSIAKYLTGPKQPVTGISWKDAEAYAKWLSQKSGFNYRLPSEKEWEYAARAGSVTPYWWGTQTRRDGKAMACCEGCGSDLDMKGLYPVDAFKPNPWGLYNVHGNVWEWVADYFCEDYTSSPIDGTPRTDPSCPKQFDPEGLKIFRGGSCFYGPRQMRASMRLRNSPDLRNMTIGFRVARDLK